MAFEVVTVEPLRSVAGGFIVAGYASVGTTPYDSPIRLVCFTNTTDQNVVVSLDGIIDNFIVPHDGFKLLDLSTNKVQTGTIWCFPVGTLFWIRNESGINPVRGNFYIEALTGGTF
jgi:hypothetical protein